MVAIAFIGPSLSRERAAELAPDALLLDPAAQGDVAAAVVAHRPRVIALIDGVFRERLAVWHKELLWAMGQGVVVAGAASMGALRAAELDEYGMIGVGQVYERLCEGLIAGDDEVAVVHAGGEEGWRVLTVAMVDVRATAATLAAAGAVEAQQADAVVCAAAALPFERRTWAGIGRAAGLDPDALKAWAAARTDCKGADATQLMGMLVELAHSSPPARSRRDERLHGPLMRIMLRRDRPTATPEGPGPTPADIVGHAAIERDDFYRLDAIAVQRSLCLHLATLLQVEVTAADLASSRERFANRLDLVNDADWERWQAQNDLTSDELKTLLTEEAVLTALRRWWVATAHKLRNVGMVVDQLRLDGDYVVAKNEATRAARAARRLHPEHRRVPPPQSGLAALLRAQAKATGLVVTQPVAAWLGDAGFTSWDQLAVALECARALRQNTQTRSPDVVDAQQQPIDP